MIKSNKVQALHLRNCSFSDANLQAALVSRGLFSVTFSRCKISIPNINKVRRLRPDLTIVAEPEAFLGVQGPLDVTTEKFSGCQISRVVPDSGAAESGMKAEDVVVEIDGQKISQFEDLRLLVSQGKAGDTLNLKVMRSGKPVDLKVTLGKLESFR